jgi:hypothetical protein
MNAMCGSKKEQLSEIGVLSVVKSIQVVHRSRYIECVLISKEPSRYARVVDWKREGICKPSLLSSFYSYLTL